MQDGYLVGGAMNLGGPPARHNKFFLPKLWWFLTIIKHSTFIVNQPTTI